MTDKTFHKTQFQQLGYTVFTNAVSPALVNAMRSKVQAAQSDDLVKGDESTHSWREIAINASELPNQLILDQNVESTISSSPHRSVHWLNIYNVDEYIGGHVDAGGEVQLMLPIELPDAGLGGEIWVGSPRKILPVSIGDALLFAAHQIPHGTTKILAGRRISLNVRMWLS
jgi:hypothetical protein